MDPAGKIAGTASIVMQPRLLTKNAPLRFVTPADGTEAEVNNFAPEKLSVASTASGAHAVRHNVDNRVARSRPKRSFVAINRR